MKHRGEIPPTPNREIALLDNIERDLDATQATLATRLGVADEADPAQDVLNFSHNQLAAIVDLILRT